VDRFELKQLKLAKNTIRALRLHMAFAVPFKAFERSLKGLSRALRKPLQTF
jgi:hypothetical protein